MKVVILAGGFGTRLSEETDIIPKPLVKIGKYPIILHIISHFVHFGHKDFLIAGGYKVELLERFFGGEIKLLLDSRKINISVIDTGINANTSERLGVLEDFLVDEFFLTYGDGLADVNLDQLVDQRRNLDTICTVTAVRPPPRFGNLEIKHGLVTRFAEKDPLRVGWINGGFFCMAPEIFANLGQSDSSFENEPMQRLVESGQLSAHNHEGFWQPMDTLRDKRVLEDMWIKGHAPWENRTFSLR